MQHRPNEPRRGVQNEIYSGKLVCSSIGGRSVQETSGDRFIVQNPATGVRLQEFYGATSTSIDVALMAAEKAFPSWENTSIYAKADIILNAVNWLASNLDQISVDITCEQGKPYSEARAEVIESVEILRWFAEQSKRGYGRHIPSRLSKVSYSVHRRAVGPVAVFTPWNSPLATPVRTVAAALCAGCTVVLKPSEEAPSASLWLAEAFAVAGLPDGVLNVLFGNPDTISRRLISSEVIRKISFTGSKDVGRKIAAMAGETLKPISLELGGHAPVLVFDDVDIDSVTQLARRFKFENAGQICTSPTRFFVHQSVYQDFIDAMITQIDELVVGEGWLEDVDMGPLANVRRLQAMEHLTMDAINKGASLISGGARLGDRGCFFGSTILADVPEHAEVMITEPFGPILLAIPFKTDDEVLQKANALPYGLAGYVFSNNADRLVRCQFELEVGMVGLNSFDISLPETPFTGIKDSGYGYACGEEGLDNFVVNRLTALAL